VASFASVGVCLSIGAHSVPAGSDAASAAARIIEHDLPEIMKRKARQEVTPELIDVFCEKGVFELQETRAILQAGKNAGLDINFHGHQSDNRFSLILLPSSLARLRVAISLCPLICLLSVGGLLRHILYLNGVR
jgi:imidazolonepropionase-like amidohydrolase